MSEDFFKEIQRDLGGQQAALDPEFSTRLDKLKEELTARKIPFKIGSGFRTLSEQATLKKQKPRLAASPDASLHPKGLAIDINVEDKYHGQIGEIAESLGLTWGGRWKKREPWHIEYRRGSQSLAEEMASELGPGQPPSGLATTPSGAIALQHQRGTPRFVSQGATTDFDAALKSIDSQIGRLSVVRQGALERGIPERDRAPIENKWLALHQQRSDLLRQQFLARSQQPGTGMVSAMRQPSSGRGGPSKSEGFQRYAESIAENTPGGLMGGMLGSALDLVGARPKVEATPEDIARENAIPALAKPFTQAAEQVVGLVEGQKSEFDKARELYIQKHSLTDPEMLGRWAAALVPIYGPMAAKVGEQLGEGDVAGALGTASMLVAAEVGGGRLAKGKKTSKVEPLTKTTELGGSKPRSLSDRLQPGPMSQRPRRALASPEMDLGQTVEPTTPAVASTKATRTTQRPSERPPAIQVHGPTGEVVGVARNAAEAMEMLPKEERGLALYDPNVSKRSVPELVAGERAKQASVKPPRTLETIKAENGASPESQRRLAGEEPPPLPEVPWQAPKPKQIVPTEVIPPSPPKTKPRSFPQTLERAGLPKGTDLDYEVAPRAESWAKAQKTLSELGPDGAADVFRRTTSASADDMATGLAAYRSYVERGDIDKARALADDLAQKMTSQGQSTSMAALITEQSAGGALLRAQKISRETGKELTEKASKRITENGQVLHDGQKRVSTLERQMESLQGRVARLETPTAPKLPKAPRSPSVSQALSQAVEAARKRVKTAEKNIGERGVIGESVPGVGSLDDAALIGADEMLHGTFVFDKWSERMRTQFHKNLEPHLTEVYRESWNIVAKEREKLKAQRLDKKLSSIQQTHLATLDEAYQIFREQENIRAQNLKAQRALAKELNNLDFERTAIAATLDVLSIPKTLASTADVSMTLRQGLWFTLLHPIKNFLGVKGDPLGSNYWNQLKALTSENRYNTIINTIEADKMTPVLEKAGVHFSSLLERRRPGSISPREEYFASKAAEKLTGGKRGPVRMSNRAAMAYLDGQRLMYGKILFKELMDKGYTPEKNPAQFRALGDFVNKTTARGRLGRLDSTSPWVSALGLFSPRNLAARVQLMNPFYYGRLPKGTRQLAIKEAAKFYTTMGLLVAGASQIPGVTVSTDVDDDDFLKVKVGGEVRADLTGGFQSPAKLVFQIFDRIGQAVSEKDPGKKQDHLKDAAYRIWRFYRGKSAPPTGAIIDYITGETFLSNSRRREETSTWTMARDHIGVPFIVGDFVEAYKEQGLAFGLASLPITGHGVGLSVYKDTPKPTASQKRQERRAKERAKSTAQRAEERRKKKEKEREEDE